VLQPGGDPGLTQDALPVDLGELAVALVERDALDRDLATSRWSSSSVARQTTPMPPRPSCSCSR
jgi:hypothetical protein